MRALTSASCSSVTSMSARVARSSKTEYSPPKTA